MKIILSLKSKSKGLGVELIVAREQAVPPGADLALPEAPAIGQPAHRPGEARWLN